MSGLSVLDLAIILLYLVTIPAIGIWVARRKDSAEGYFVGDRKVPWWAVLGSLVATEVSAATFLATPGVGYHGNLAYLQFGLGSLLGRILVSTAFLGLLYRYRCLSVYEFLKVRFGRQSQRAGAIFFILSRLCASSVRLMIATTGLHLILGWPLELTLILFAGLCLLYAGWGGIRSVIWTDCLQGLIFLVSGGVVLWFISNALGGVDWLFQAAEAGRWEVFSFTPSDPGGLWAWLADANLFWLAFLFGTINTMAMMGTDHDFTQRLLSCSKVEEARRGLILSGLISLPIAGTFLALGVGLSYYFQVFPAALPMDEAGKVISDKVFPFFIAEVLPAGVKGLVITGVLAAAMSSLDSALAALSSSGVIDLGGKRDWREGSPVRRSRWLMVLACCILVVMAWLLKDGGQFLWLAFKVSAVTYSGLLGVFLAGVMSQRGKDSWNPWFMVGGSMVVLVLTLLIEKGYLALAWQWPMIIGVGVTGALVCLPKPNSSPNDDT